MFDDGEVPRDSRKQKSSHTDVISKMPKPKFVACSVICNATREVSHTQRASAEVSKSKEDQMKNVPVQSKNFREQFR